MCFKTLKPAPVFMVLFLPRPLPPLDPKAPGLACLSLSYVPWVAVPQRPPLVLPSNPPPSVCPLWGQAPGFPPPHTPVRLLGWVTSFIPHFLNTVQEGLGRKSADANPPSLPTASRESLCLVRGCSRSHPQEAAIPTL